VCLMAPLAPATARSRRRHALTCRRRFTSDFFKTFMAYTSPEGTSRTRNTLPKDPLPNIWRGTTPQGRVTYSRVHGGGGGRVGAPSTCSPVHPSHVQRTFNSSKSSTDTLPCRRRSHRAAGVSSSALPSERRSARHRKQGRSNPQRNRRGEVRRNNRGGGGTPSPTEQPTRATLGLQAFNGRPLSEPTSWHMKSRGRHHTNR
jgi:hypothetical protein